MNPNVLFNILFSRYYHSIVWSTLQNIHEILQGFFPCQVFKIQGILFYTHSASQFKLASLQVPHGYAWLGASALDNTCLHLAKAFSAGSFKRSTGVELSCDWNMALTMLGGQRGWGSSRTLTIMHCLEQSQRGWTVLPKSWEGFFFLLFVFCFTENHCFNA